DHTMSDLRKVFQREVSTATTGCSGEWGRSVTMLLPGSGAVAEPRIDDEIEDVDDEGDDHEHQGHEDQVGGHDPHVDGSDRIDEQGAESRPSEPRCSEDGEDEGRTQLQAGNGGNWHYGIGLRMAEIDRPPAEAARAGEADISGPQHFEHSRTHQAHDQRAVE